ncbi:DNA phosphorothioation-dependent restriction protein DptG [Vibrio spartinae]|uniref:DNA phosphorothioation-dependent restriction protein DptG n=1 Tax=Vibrio spartinae TaxID=1918945 RepID=A0ABX6QWK8_9VIBR|nr:DNA phosphorothioation-dependent restriction protein DptG [Vibrio spartinae]QMV13588.1 DNA phosphorothioation-dependent restriction protein DptG [Vibrio spartinae]
MILDKYIRPFNPKLPQTSQDVAEKNNLNSYFPIRTNEKPFDWNAVIGLVLQGLLRKKIEKYSYEEFVQDCKSVFDEKLGEDDFWTVLREMYFDKKDIFSVSPELLLFCAQKDQYSSVDGRVASMFNNLLQNMQIEKFDSDLNFIEKQMLSTLNSKLKDSPSAFVNESPYLPFLAKSFREDLKFLSRRPKYLLSEIKQLLSFYAFSYTAQLSLALPDWRSGREPQPKPLYFIMDHERASKERIHIKKYGHSLFKESLNRLFPVLTMLEMLQPDIHKTEPVKVPLWEISKRIQETAYEDSIQRLTYFAFAFREKRGLTFEFKPSDDALELLEQILHLAEAQFKSGGKKGLDEKYANSVEKIMAPHFIQNRGRSGRVLVLNQDYIILLTNLVIGEADKLRFHELIAEFKQRGIFVDKQTEQELIKFYERIGNVERMSDSGDAVYVRKTI